MCTQLTLGNAPVTLILQLQEECMSNIEKIIKLFSQMDKGAQEDLVKAAEQYVLAFPALTLAPTLLLVPRQAG